MTTQPKPSTLPRRRPPATREKVAVTLPKGLVAAARAEVQTRRSLSFSALVAEALAEKLERDYLQEVLDQMAAEYGSLAPEELAWADRVLDS